MSQLGAGQLGMDGFLTDLFAPWVAPGKRKDARKAAADAHARKMAEEEVEREESLRRRKEMAVTRALENRQNELARLIAEMGNGANEVGALVESIRVKATSGELDQDPQFVNSLLDEVSEWEAGLIKVQSAGRGAVGSADMTELSEAIEEATRAVFVVKSIRNRAFAAVKRIDQKVKANKAEEIRLQNLLRERERIRVLEDAQIARSSEANERRQVQRDREAAREQRIADMRRSMDLDVEIAREKRLLRKASSELERERSLLASGK